MATGPVPLEEGGGADADRLLRGSVGRGIHLASGGINYQCGKIILWNWPGRGGV